MANKKVKRLVVVFAVFWTLFGAFLYDLKILGIFADRDLFEYITLLLVGIVVSLSIKSKLKYVWISILIFNCIERIMPFVHNQNIYYLIGVITGLVLCGKLIYNRSKLSY